MTCKRFAIGDEVLPPAVTDAPSASFKGRDIARDAAIARGIYTRHRVYLYEMDTDDLYAHHHITAQWVSTEKRIYEVEPIGDRESDQAWDPEPSWCSYPKATVKRCLYDPESYQR